MYGKEGFLAREARRGSRELAMDAPRMGEQISQVDSVFRKRMAALSDSIHRTKRHAVPEKTANLDYNTRPDSQPISSEK